MRGTIVVRKGDQQVPDDYLLKVMAENPHGGGLALLDEEGVWVTGRHNTEIPIDDVQGVFKAYPHENTILFFSKDELSLEEDIQPYAALQDADGNDIIYAFIAAEVPGSNKAGSTHVNEWHFAREVLMPRLQRMYRLVGEDLDTLMNELNDPGEVAYIANQLSPGGVIVLFAENDRTMTFCNKAAGAQAFEWGWVSATHGYGEPIKDAKPAEPAKKTGLVSAVRKAVKLSGEQKVTPELPRIPESDLPGPKDNDPPFVPDVPKPAPVVAPIGAMMVTCPDTITKGKAIKRWYQNHAGFCPPNYMDHPTVQSKIVQPLKALADIKTETAAAPPKTVDGTLAKDTSPKHVGDPTPQPKEDGATKEFAPIIAPEIKAKIITDFLQRQPVIKAIGKSSEEISDPKQFAKLEDRWPTFMEQMGNVPNSDVLSWPKDVWLWFGREYGVEALAVAANTAASKGRTFRHKFAQTIKKDGEVVPATPAAPASPAPASPAEAPVAKAKFSVRQSIRK